jgi:hypothetical protein
MFALSLVLERRFLDFVRKGHGAVFL